MLNGERLSEQDPHSISQLISSTKSRRRIQKTNSVNKTDGMENIEEELDKRLSEVFCCCTDAFKHYAVQNMMTLDLDSFGSVGATDGIDITRDSTWAKLAAAGGLNLLVSVCRINTNST